MQTILKLLAALQYQELWQQPDPENGHAPFSFSMIWDLSISGLHGCSTTVFMLIGKCTIFVLIYRKKY